jgi:predicted nucleic acid-binding protein
LGFRGSGYCLGGDRLGIGNYDALHLASAIHGQANLLVSTDDRLLKLGRSVNNILGMLPGEALAFVEKWYEN